MAAIMGRRPIRQRKTAGSPYANVKIEDGGKHYRVCYAIGSLRVLVIGLKCSAGGERYLEPRGRRARQIIRLTGLDLRV